MGNCYFSFLTIMLQVKQIELNEFYCYQVIGYCYYHEKDQILNPMHNHQELTKVLL